MPQAHETETFRYYNFVNIFNWKILIEIYFNSRSRNSAPNFSFKYSQKVFLIGTNILSSSRVYGAIVWNFKLRISPAL